MIWLLLAGTPPEIKEVFQERLTKMQRIDKIISCQPLEWNTPYCANYLEAIYSDLVAALRGIEVYQQKIKVLLLYVEKDGSSELLEKFGVELLVTSFTSRCGNQIPRIGRMLGDARDAIDRSVNVLSIIQQQCSSGNTCLLLPERNFGSRFRREILSSVRKAIEIAQEFDRCQRAIKRANQKLRVGNSGPRIFSANNIRFRPAIYRHGTSPAIGDDNHEPSCGIRGRFRFGVPYDPKFHYDCCIRYNSKELINCHGPNVVRQRGHVNIAPNDNIR